MHAPALLVALLATPATAQEPADEVVVCAGWLTEALDAFDDGTIEAATDQPEDVDDTLAAIRRLLELDADPAEPQAVVGSCPDYRSDGGFYLASVVDAGRSADGTRYATLAYHGATDWDFVVVRTEFRDGQVRAYTVQYDESEWDFVSR